MRKDDDAIFDVANSKTKSLSGVKRKEIFGLMQKRAIVFAKDQAKIRRQQLWEVQCDTFVVPSSTFHAHKRSLGDPS